MFPGLAASAAGYTADAAMGEVIDENVLDNHCRVASDDHQRDAAWFGAGAALKQNAGDEAMKLLD